MNKKKCNTNQNEFKYFINQEIYVYSIFDSNYFYLYVLLACIDTTLNIVIYHMLAVKTSYLPRAFADVCPMCI